MKFAIIMLVVLGIVAAGAATLFLQSMSLFQQPKEVATFDVLVATADLAPRTALTEALVEVKKMPKTGLPADYLSNWSQAAGKILKLAVVKGQPLANSSFIPKDSVDDLLRPGMLAFPIHLNRRVTAENLFYPGCVVDVFATFPLTNQRKGEAVVFPLLQGVRVLAVANETVVSAAQAKTAAPQPRSQAAEAVVTLEVNSRQASALQLAMERGTLGLAMRNPTDTSVNPMDSMVVKEGQLTAASETLDPQTLAMVGSIQKILNPERTVDVNAPKTVAASQLTAKVSDPNAPASPMLPQVNLPLIPAIQSKKTGWPVEIIRGQKVETTDVQAGSGEEANKGTEN